MIGGASGGRVVLVGWFIVIALLWPIVAVRYWVTPANNRTRDNPNWMRDDYPWDGWK